MSFADWLWSVIEPALGVKTIPESLDRNSTHTGVAHVQTVPHHIDRGRLKEWHGSQVINRTTLVVNTHRAINCRRLLRRPDYELYHCHYFSTCRRHRPCFWLTACLRRYINCLNNNNNNIDQYLTCLSFIFKTINSNQNSLWINKSLARLKQSTMMPEQMSHIKQTAHWYMYHDRIGRIGLFVTSIASNLYV